MLVEVGVDCLPYRCTATTMDKKDITVVPAKIPHVPALMS
jgi:hypothetical protein